MKFERDVRSERAFSLGRRADMSGMKQNRSEVAQLLSQITDEYEAALRGLSGIAYGTSQHDFITAKMENMDQLHQQLQTLVGDNAISLIADRLSALG